MSFEIRISGLTVSGVSGGRLRLHAEPGTVVTTTEFAAVSAFLDTLALGDDGSQAQPARALGDASHGFEAIAVPPRPAAYAAGPARVSGGSAAAAPASTPVAAASGLPGRPRTIPLGSGTAKAAATPTAPLAAVAAAAADKPKEKGKPGRPRKNPVVAAAPVAAAAASTAPTAEKSAAAPKASRGRPQRLVDQFDGWMKENPGPKTREELIKVAVDNGWLTPEDSKRLFAVCMNRERALFNRVIEGGTEVYIRRAEANQTSPAPGKIVRHPGGRPGVR